MKVLTINVHGWLEKDSHQKIKQLAAVIAEKDYEVVALQEVNQLMENMEVSHSRFIQSTNEVNEIPLKEENYVGVLVQELEALGKKYYWSWSANHIGYDRYDEGLSILSKSKQEAETITVSETSEYDTIATRNVLKSTVQIDGEEWIVLNGHFSWWKDAENNLVFKNEWDRMQQHLENINNKERIIFMGDFNNEADLSDQGYDYLLEQSPYLKDSYTIAEKKTGHATMSAGIDGWEDATSGKRIDLIFVSQDVEVEESHVIFDGKNKPVISDHFGVEVKIKTALH